MKVNEMKQLSVMCGILHNLFSKEPEHQWLTQFQDEGVFEQWPGIGQESEDAARTMAASLVTDTEEVLLKDFNRLFVLAPKLAYPWGSVYTDRNHLLFGETTRRWDDFLLKEQIEVSTPGNDPLDHIGIMLAVLSRLLQEGEEKQAQVIELLSRHLLPWGYRFCQLVKEGAGTGFYRGAGRLLKSTLRYLQSIFRVSPDPIPIFV